MNIRFPSLSLPALETDVGRLKQRIFRPLDKGEFLGLALAGGITLAFAWQHAHHVYPFHYDLGNYLKTAQGDFSAYFYAYWFLPVFNLLARWPFPLAFVFWNFLNIAGVFFATRVFGGKVLWTLASYQMLYTLFQGNIAGILAGALALMWFSMVNNRWLWSGLFLLVASTKYQIGVPFGLLLLWYVPGEWRQKARALIPPMAITLVSFLMWGFWPWKVWNTIQNHPPDMQGNITLWSWFGVFALAFWLPPLFGKFSASHRLTMLLGAIFLGQPYLQQSDLIVLFPFLPNFLPLLGNAGYLLAALRFDLLRFMAFLPLTLYLWTWFRASGFPLSAREGKGTTS